ncbi:hypothetical protein [Microcystis phage Mwe-JY13]
MQNLQEIIPAFFTGPGGAKLTPEQIAARKEVAQSLLAKATDTSPNAGGWASILSKGIMGLSSGIQEGRAERAALANSEADQALSSKLFGLFGSGSTPSTGSWDGMAPASPTTSDVASALVPSSGGMPAQTAMVEGQPPIPGLQPAVTDIAAGIRQSAEALGIDPVDLATVISYETGGTFDPMQKGPTTKWGQHKGLIQFGEPQAEEYGVDWNNPLASQLGPEGAVVKYLRSNGVTPGMGLLDVYSTINAGAPGLYDRSDAAAGGAPGTVRDKVENQMGGHRAKALALFGGNQSGAADAVNAMGAQAGYVDPMVSVQPATQPSTQAAPATAASGGIMDAIAPPMSADYFPPAPSAPQAGAIDPAVIEALSSPYASPQTKQVASMLLERTMTQQQQAQERALQERQRAAEIQQRQAFLQANGLDPSIAMVDEAWAEAAKAPFRPRNTVVVNGVLVDAETGTPVYQAAPEPTTGMRDYDAYADQVTAAGGTPLGRLEYEQALRSSGAPRTEAAPPAGYRYVRDAQGNIMSMEAIPGGPADTSAMTQRQAGHRETSSDVVTNAAVRAVQALSADGMPTTGLIGRGMALLPESNAAEVRRQVDVLKSNATVENLTAMRQASPTGGALGSVTEKEGAMLAAKSGALDPDSPNFARDLKDYTRTMLEIIHGPDAGRKMFESMSWGGSADAPQSGEEAIPEGIDPGDWKFMTPEERRLFQ